MLSPEAVATADARRAFTALALHGYRVDEVIVNRVFPDAADGSPWQRDWVAAQAVQLDAIADSFAGLPIRRSRSGGELILRFRPDPQHWRPM